MNKAELAQLQARLDDSLSLAGSWATDDLAWQQAQECYHDLCTLVDTPNVRLPAPSRTLLNEYKSHFESQASSIKRDLFDVDLFKDAMGSVVSPLSDVFRTDDDHLESDDYPSDEASNIVEDDGDFHFESLFDTDDSSPPSGIPLITASTKLPSPTLVFDSIPPELNPSFNIWDPYLDPKRKELLIAAMIKWTHEVLIERYRFNIPACFPMHEYAVDVLYAMHQTWITAIKGSDENREAYLKWIKDFEYVHTIMVKGHLGECFAPCIKASTHVDTRIGPEQEILDNAMDLENVDQEPTFKLRL